MTDELGGREVAVLATDGVEHIAAERSRGALHGAGAETGPFSLPAGEINARQGVSTRRGPRLRTRRRPTRVRTTTRRCRWWAAR